MKKLILVLTAMLAVCAFSGAAPGVENVLFSVQEVIFQPQGETRIYTNNFADGTIALQSRLSWYAVAAKISNVTNDVLFLSWNKSAFIDAQGISHRVAPGETMLLDQAREIPETMIPPKASIEILIYPSEFWTGNAGNSRTILEYPTATDFAGNVTGLLGKQTKAYATFAKKYEGRTISLMLSFHPQNGSDIYYKFDMSLDFAKGVPANLLDNAAAAGSGQKTAEQPVPLPPAVGLTLDKELVAGVRSGSIAEKAGLAKGDRILEVNGKKSSEVENLLGLIEERVDSGSSVMVMYERAGKQDMAILKKKK